MHDAWNLFLMDSDEWVLAKRLSLEQMSICTLSRACDWHCMLACIVYMVLVQVLEV